MAVDPKGGRGERYKSSLLAAHDVAAHHVANIHRLTVRHRHVAGLLPRLARADVAALDHRVGLRHTVHPPNGPSTRPGAISATGPGRLRSSVRPRTASREPTRWTRAA